MTKKQSVINKVGINCNDLAEKLLSSLLKEEVFVIENGINLYDQNGWLDFLENECNLQIDRRHFPSDLTYSDWWEVSYQPNKATAYAYSKTKQPLHTDNAWYSDPPEVNFFIMKKQAVKGGELTIYPVSRLISDLQNDDSNLLDQLLTTKVRFSKGGDENYYETTIITLESEPKVIWNYYRFDRNNKKIEEMCEAFFDFLKNKENTNSVEQFCANTGDCFCLNDQKFLHGRNAFEAEKDYDRILLVSLWKFTA